VPLNFFHLENEMESSNIKLCLFTVPRTEFSPGVFYYDSIVQVHLIAFAS
jgi:hypothetical protein